MTVRTFAIGDIHGQLDQLLALLGRLPDLTPDDTIVFIGDYLDRGPDSAEVIHLLMEDLPGRTPAKIVCLKGNHEDAWLNILAGEDSAFALHPSNGCLSTMHSFLGHPPPMPGAFPSSMKEMESLTSGSFLPLDVVSWMRNLPYFHEDQHAIYVHGGLTLANGHWLHPSMDPDPKRLLWNRDVTFFESYRGKRVVFGHTPTTRLPQHLSVHTPSDPSDAYVSGDLIGIDTGCGRSGFLSAVELPSLTVYESRVD